MSLKPKSLDDAIDFIFVTYDQENKGKLSIEQALRFFTELFAYFQFRADPKQLDYLFNMMDHDNDGFISRDELYRVIKNREYYLL